VSTFAVARPDEGRSNANASVLLVCGSRKPAPGVDRPSASRELLRLAGEGIVAAGGQWEWLDLRDFTLPFFDGRSVDAYCCSDLDRIAAAVRGHATILLSVPAYWSGPAGVMKNLLDLLGGAAYDTAPGMVPPLVNKLVALLVVASDTTSGHAAVSAMRGTVQALGAWTPPQSAMVTNPRRARRPEALVEAMREFGTYVARLSADERVPWHAAAHA